MNIKTFLLKLSVVVVMAVSFFACSKLEYVGPLKYASADHKVVASLNLKKVYENAGFDITSDGVLPSEAFKKILTSYSEEDVAELMRMPGIHLERVVVMADEGEDATVAFDVDDFDKFNSWLEANGFKSHDGPMSAYSRDDSLSIVFVDGDGFIFRCAPKDAYTKFESLWSAAKEKPLASWQKEVLSEDNPVTMIADLTSLYRRARGESQPASAEEGKSKSYMVLTSSLSGLELKGEAHLCDADGKMVKLEIDAYPLASFLLRYVNDSDCAVALMAMPKGLDFADIARMSGLSGIFAEVASVFNGTHSLLAAGSVSDIDIDHHTAAWNGVLALEMESGAAEKLFRMARMFGSQAGAVASPDGSEVKASFMDMDLSLKADGDNLVLRLNGHYDTDGIPSIKASDFGDSYGGIVVGMPAESSAAKSFGMPFGVDFKSMLATDGADISLSLTGTSGNLLENVIEFIASKQ